MQATIILYYKEKNSKSKKNPTYQSLQQIQSKQGLLAWRQYFTMHSKNSYTFTLKKIITLQYLIVGDTELIILANQKEVNVILNLFYIFQVYLWHFTRQVILSQLDT